MSTDDDSYALLVDAVYLASADFNMRDLSPFEVPGLPSPVSASTMRFLSQLLHWALDVSATDEEVIDALSSAADGMMSFEEAAAVYGRRVWWHAKSHADTTVDCLVDKYELDVMSSAPVGPSKRHAREMVEVLGWCFPIEGWYGPPFTGTSLRPRERGEAGRDGREESESVLKTLKRREKHMGPLQTDLTRASVVGIERTMPARQVTSVALPTALKDTIRRRRSPAKRPRSHKPIIVPDATAAC